ncbi:MAG: hypothetical protein R3E01_28430 [Pirellulaceae bacterium]|nr:hypothetical protein [Planctomycetales bacterium]
MVGAAIETDPRTEVRTEIHYQLPRPTPSSPYTPRHRVQIVEPDGERVSVVSGQRMVERLPAPPAGEPLPPIPPIDQGVANMPSPAEPSTPISRQLEPIFERMLQSPRHDWRIWKHWGPNRCLDVGLGYELAGVSLFEMDSAETMNQFRFRFAATYNHETPDMAEYFWARTGGRGPGLAESGVDYQEVRLMMETGGPRLSVQTEIPIRILDPENNDNTAGLSDMTVTTKTVLIQGERLQLTQIFRNYFNTGDVPKGLGTGHVSLEPGLLLRSRLGPRTTLHGELKYWIPLGGDPTVSGQILRYGLGVSRVWREHDDHAVVPTLEFVAFSVLDGQKTVIDSLGNAVRLDVDGATIVNIYPGIWFVSERHGKTDLGLGTGFSITDVRQYQQVLRLDLRFRF